MIFPIVPTSLDDATCSHVPVICCSTRLRQGEKIWQSDFAFNSYVLPAQGHIDGPHKNVRIAKKMGGRNQTCTE